MQDIADELVESWINGNLLHVIERLTTTGAGKKGSGVRVALLSALVFSQLDAQQRMVFLRMLKDKV